MIAVEEGAARRALADMLRHPRFEVLPLEGSVEAAVRHLPRDLTVTITASPQQGIDGTVAAAERLAAEGYDVVPHLSARLVRGEEHLAELLGRLEVARIRDIFVIGGDPPEPAGPYAAAADLLRAMSERRAAFERIGISGYPETHHLISDEETIEAMTTKATMATYIVSQVAFDADVIAGWIEKVRARGTQLPIWVGVPGSVDQRKLLRISMKIGLGESARFLRSHRDWVRRLALRRRYTPDDLIQALAPVAARPEARVAGLHVYTFNEVEESERWRRALLARIDGA